MTLWFRKRSLKAGVFILLMFASLMGGCGPSKSSKPVVSDSDLKSQSDAAIATFGAERRIDSRETILEVQCSAAQGKVTLTGRTSDEALKVALVDRIKAIQGATVVDQVAVLPTKAVGEKTWAVVSVPVLNLGDGPKSAEGSHTVTQARMGDVLRLLDQSEGWYLAQMDDNYLGWVDPAAIATFTKSALDAFWSGKAALVSAKMAAAAKTAGGERVFEQDLVQGSVLPLVSVDAKWACLRLPGGSEAWVEASNVSVFPDLSAVFAEKKGVQAVIATAKQFLGLPYHWGGTTGYGFDCSGLVQFCLKMNGYRVRRDADMQYEMGDPIADRASLQPGDVVFFQTYRQGASHVGIYIGDSRYIQSGGSSGLSIWSFNPAHADYSASLDKAYLGARRIIK